VSHLNESFVGCNKSLSTCNETIADYEKLLQELRKRESSYKLLHATDENGEYLHPTIDICMDMKRRLFAWLFLSWNRIYSSTFLLLGELYTSVVSALALMFTILAQALTATKDGKPLSSVFKDHVSTQLWSMGLCAHLCYNCSPAEWSWFVASCCALLIACYGLMLCARYIWIKPRERTEMDKWKAIFDCIYVNALCVNPHEYDMPLKENKLQTQHHAMLTHCRLLKKFVSNKKDNIEQEQVNMAEVCKFVEFLQQGFGMYVKYYRTYQEEYFEYRFKNLKACTFTLKDTLRQTMLYLNPAVVVDGEPLVAPVVPQQEAQEAVQLNAVDNALLNSMLVLYPLTMQLFSSMEHNALHRVLRG